MKVVIVGGYDRMVRQYINICGEFGCKAKVCTRRKANIDCMIGRPDLLILITNPVSHSLILSAKKSAAQYDTPIVQTHSGSGTAIRNILVRHWIGG
jgi:hypothetical protein